MLSDSQIEENKSKIISLLNSTGRKGMENVVRYLDKNGFFIVPSSRERHHNWKGGLAQHSLGVYERLSKTGEGLPPDSLIIVSLLHDICKTRQLYYDEHGHLHNRHLHIPGHGYRSVKILENLGLDLKDDERGAIRWHMGGYNIDKSEIRDFFKTKKSDLWRLHHNADRYDASHNGK